MVRRRCRACRSNQKCDRPVSTRPLSGISSGSTTSNTDTRSLATISSRSWLDLVELADLARVEMRQRRSSLIRRQVAPARRARRTTRPVLASARFRSKQASSRAVVERRRHVGVLGEQVAERALLLPRPHRVALHDAGTRRRGVAPASTSASSTGWLNTSPNDASMLRSMRSGYTRMPVDDLS